MYLCQLCCSVTVEVRVGFLCVVPSLFFLFFFFADGVAHVRQ